jgi:hypothetical protein
MPTANKQPFDPAAFVAAATAAAKVKTYPVDLPGVGACWVRALTFGDEMASFGAREALAAQGVVMNRQNLAAMRLAQNLCGPEGEPIFDPGNAEHLKVLAALPLESIGEALMQAGQAEGRSGPKG